MLTLLVVPIYVDYTPTKGRVLAAPRRVSMMSWKVALALPALVTSLAALAACGGTDDCVAAAEKMTSCGVSQTTTGAGGMPPMAMPCMTPFATCEAQCTNTATCSEISPPQGAYATCLKRCQQR